jgi:hypothetical protein
MHQGWKLVYEWWYSQERPYVVLEGDKTERNRGPEEEGSVASIRAVIDPAMPVPLPKIVNKTRNVRIRV